MKMYYIIKNNKEIVIYNKSMIYISNLCQRLQRADKNNTYYIEVKEVEGC